MATNEAVRIRVVAVAMAFLLFAASLSAVLVRVQEASADPLAPALSAVNAYTSSANTPTCATSGTCFADSWSGVSNGNVGEAIENYKWMVNLDNTFDGLDPSADCVDSDGDGFVADFPADCTWTSLRAVSGDAPVVAYGDQGDWGSAALGGLPAGNYLVTVVADGHKVGGAPFTIPLAVDAPVVVRLDPYPLPTLTVRVKVFNDEGPINGTFDIPSEDPAGPEALVPACTPETSVSPTACLQSMAGFTAILSDNLDELITDVFGNPICTEYVTDGTGRIVLGDHSVEHPMFALTEGADPGSPTAIPGSGGRCVSDEFGDIVIPNLGENRYAVLVAPPEDGRYRWVQTSTLEGGLDHDVWAMANDHGYDTEMISGTELTPWVRFGFVRTRQGPPVGGVPTPLFYEFPTPCPTICPPTTGNSTVKGVVAKLENYVPPITGIPFQGKAGSNVTSPVNRPYIGISDLGVDADRWVYMGRGESDGSFEVTGLHDGTYLITVWDEDLDFHLDLMQISVNGNEVVDLGTLGLFGWFANFHGHVFADSNENGVRDRGEQGVPNFALVMKDRANNLAELGQNAATTDQSGYFEFSKKYPTTYWQVLEAYSDGYHTTGVTYQASNQTEATTVLGTGVDLNILPIIGQSGRVDWGVLPYRPGQNGGIVGTVAYDNTTINELEMRLGATEDWSPGIPGMTVNLWQAIPEGLGGGDFVDPRVVTGDFVRGIVDGGIVACLAGDPGCDPLQSAQTEAWVRPENCVARDGEGVSLGDGVNDASPSVEQAWPQEQAGSDCIEAAMMGTQFGAIPFDADGNQVAPDSDYDDWNASVDGNYGFGDLAPGMYLVEVDAGSITDINGDPVYRTQVETDINVFGGDVYTPQNAAGNPSAGGLGGSDAYVGRRPVDNPATYAPGSTPRCMGDEFTVDLAGQAPDGPDPAENPSFLDAGGSPFEGTVLRKCDVKLVGLTDRRSVAPVFNFTTVSGVPLPARYRGYLADDIAVGTNAKSTMYGEVPGIASTPIGVYDWYGRQIAVEDTDPNGHFEFLLPSTITGNCPTPSGVCPGMYRFVGNDPGVPGARNPNYNPQYRTAAATFQAWPGMTSAADSAPTRIAAVVETPNGQFNIQQLCAADTVEPVVFTVDTATDPPGPQPVPHVGPVVPSNGGGAVATARRTLTIRGDHFGAVKGSGSVKLYNTAGIGVATLTTSSWTDDQIVAVVPSGTAVGSWRLEVQRASLERSLAGITVHVLNGVPNSPASLAAGDPRVLTVGPAGGPAETFEPVANPDDVTDPLKGPGGVYAATAGDWPFIQHYLAPRPIQRALDDAAVDPANDEIVVVYPNTPAGYDPTQANVDGAWYDNPAMFSPVKLQGIGPGGVQDANGVAVQVLGSTIDGSSFWSVPAAGSGPNELLLPVEVFGVMIEGNAFTEEGLIPLLRPGSLSVGQVVYAAAQFELGTGTEGEVFDPGQDFGDPALVHRDPYTSGFKASVDGFTITGGNQQGFPGDVNEFTGNPFPAVEADGPAGEAFTPETLNVQGGAIMIDAFAEFFQITNNNVVSNGGTYGAIRVGNPWVAFLIEGDPVRDPDNYLDFVRIDHNQIVANGGSQIGGAIAIFTGADSYEVSFNNLCGNFSTTYGGALTHFGQSDNGLIERNTIVYNQAYDEGGGVMIAGEPALAPGSPSAGSGPVSISQNLFAANLGNDDGGALRFLEVGGFPIKVVNNFFTNNVSTHEGGAIALDRATRVSIVNNTIARNVTTATAATSNGLPAPAGVSTTLGSVPFMFNNIFDENYAGNWNSSTATVEGINFSDPATANRWDVGAIDPSPDLTPMYSMLDTANGTSVPGTVPDTPYSVGAPGPGNIINGTPAFVDPTLPETRVSIHAFRNFPTFRSAAIVAVDLTDIPGDYHIGPGSAAVNTGASSQDGVFAPTDDFDCRYAPEIVCRPVDVLWDMGADERPGTVTFAPRNLVLDNFNRGTGATASVNTPFPAPPGATPPAAPGDPYWIGAVTTPSTFGTSNATPCGTPDRCLRINNGTASRIWDEATFDGAQEAYFTWRTPPPSPGLGTTGMVMRANGVSVSGDPLRAGSTYVAVEYRAAILPPILPAMVFVRTKNAGETPISTVCASGASASMAAGQVLLARINDGEVEVWRKSGSTWALLCLIDTTAEDIGFEPEPGGQLGLTSRVLPGLLRLDDFGGGSL